MPKVNLKNIESGIRFFFTYRNQELKAGEKLVLLTIIRLFEENEVITKDDVCKANQAKRNTTYSLIRSLNSKGYLTSKRENKYYSYSYLTLTQKGHLFSSMLKNYIFSKNS